MAAHIGQMTAEQRQRRGVAVRPVEVDDDALEAVPGGGMFHDLAHQGTVPRGHEVDKVKALKILGRTARQRHGGAAGESHGQIRGEFEQHVRGAECERGIPVPVGAERARLTVP